MVEEKENNTATTIMEHFFEKKDVDTWGAKISDIIERNGGRSLKFLPRAKSLQVSIIVDQNAEVIIKECNEDKYSIKVVRDGHTTMVEFKCLIEPNSGYGYPQSAYYTYLAGYIYINQDCKFKVHISFIDQQDQYIVNENREFSLCTSKCMPENIFAGISKEKICASQTLIMDKFFKKRGPDTWAVKVSDVVERNGGGYSFGYLPRTKSLIVSITIDHDAEVQISECNNEKYSIKVIRDGNTTVEFKCFIETDSNPNKYGYSQSAYYTYLSGYIFIKQDCKFSVQTSFLNHQDQYIMNENVEFVTKKFITGKTVSENEKSLTSETEEKRNSEKEVPTCETPKMDTFFKKVNDTWAVKVSDVIEQNGGGCTFHLLPRTKALRVCITIDGIVKVKINQCENEKYSIRVIRNSNKTMIEFKCFIEPGSKLKEYDYPQSVYYKYLSGYIYMKQDCKFKVHILFIDQQNQYIRNEDREFFTSKFFLTRTVFESWKEELITSESKEKIESFQPSKMDTFFKKIDSHTWAVKVSDVIEQNGGGCTFNLLPRTKALRVCITIDGIAEVNINQCNEKKYSIQVIRNGHKTMVDFRCFIEPDSQLEEYDYPQTAYYTYLSGYIYIKQDCKFKVRISFIDPQNQYLRNEDREVFTSKFFNERTTFWKEEISTSEVSEEKLLTSGTWKEEMSTLKERKTASKTSNEEIQCTTGLKKKIGKWSSKLAHWWKKRIN